MSRALDPGAAAATKASNSQEVYSSIVEALKPTTSSLLDIEFLGESHPLPVHSHVVVEGNSIALPKVKLVQAFIIARQIFFKCLKDFKEENFRDLRDATSVMLLMDPEHITAANARKRILQRSFEASDVNVAVAVKRELGLIDSFLTSRLHRHTKSPTLWGHRRWLLQVSKERGLHHDIERDLKVVVLVAAERHPRNYYAWLHMRWLVQTLSESDSFSQILPAIKDWCLKHPGDTSGWSFLLFYLFSLRASKDERIEWNSSVCKEVLGLAVSFRWLHESVWVFMRTLVATGEIHDVERVSFLKALESLMAAQTEESKAWSVLIAAREWCWRVQSKGPVEPLKHTG